MFNDWSPAVYCHFKAQESKHRAAERAKPRDMVPEATQVDDNMEVWP